MIDYRIQLFWSEEDGRYVADIPELAPCTAFGATAEEALAKVEALKSAWLEAGTRGPSGAVAPPPLQRAPGPQID